MSNINNDLLLRKCYIIVYSRQQTWLLNDELQIPYKSNLQLLITEIMNWSNCNLLNRHVYRIDLDIGSTFRCIGLYVGCMLGVGEGMPIYCSMSTRPNVWYLIENIHHTTNILWLKFRLWSCSPPVVEIWPLSLNCKVEFN